jgi:hypothetical protein
MPAGWRLRNFKTQHPCPVKTLLTFIFLACAGLIFAQEAERSYIREVEAKIAGPAVSRTEKKTASQTVTAYFYDDRLILLRTMETGELANKVSSDYFLRDDSIIAVRTNKCLTSNEILDLDLYIEANRDSTGKADFSGLPTDCMLVELFCDSRKMTRTVEGNDVFDALPEFTALHKKAREDYSDIIGAIGK